MLSSAGCLSGEVATSAGPVGGPCTTPRRCSVTAGASTAAASCAVSLSELGLGVGASIHLLQEEAASVNKADTSSVWFCLSGLLDSACAQPPTRTASQTLSLRPHGTSPPLGSHARYRLSRLSPLLHPERPGVCGLVPSTIPGASPGLGSDPRMNGSLPVRSGFLVLAELLLFETYWRVSQHVSC